MDNWGKWLADRKLEGLVHLPDKVLARDWQPTDQDRDAAWELYTELRTRITTQPLHYRSGDEEGALHSLYELFGQTRTLLHKYQRKCSHFSILSIFMLNSVVRPFTARWHKIKLAGRLKNEDARGSFRAELIVLQAKLTEFQRMLGHLAEGPDFREGSESGLVAHGPTAFSLGSEIVVASLQGVPDGEMLLREKAEIVKRRAKVLGDHRSEPTNFVGLAISGGGIRSATFGLGVVQGLAEKGFLAAIDYLSTVSGGGYLGSFISSYLNSDKPEVGPGADQLPFKPVQNNEAPPIRHMRNHSKYLTEGSKLDRVRSVGQVLYGVLTNVLISVATLILVATTTFALQKTQIAGALRGEFEIHLRVWTIASVIVLTVLLIGLAIIQDLGRLGPVAHRIRDWYERISAGLLVVAGFFVLYDLQPTLFWAFHNILGQLEAWFRMSVAVVIPPLLGALVVYLKQRPWWSRLLMRVFWLSGPIAFVVFYFSLLGVLTRVWAEQTVQGFWWDTPISIFGLGVVPWWIFVVVDLAVIAYCFAFLNVNLTSPHRFYRDQVALAYLLKNDDPNPPIEDESLKLSDLCKYEKTPYHLVNAALNLSASPRADLRGRDSDFFVFSKHYCGSPILGYFPTTRWEALDAHVNLGTAMAISGAAAAPIMGMASIFGASFLLALLNVRLAYWIRDPNPKKQWLLDMKPAILSGPGPLYVLREMMGLTSEATRYVNVSDGGHLENLGIYELLRRRCKFIIAIDGEQDPFMTFGSLIRVIRFAHIDFGINIDIDLSDLRIDDAGFSKAHFALGKIDYGNGEQGFLLYIKSSLTGNELDYVLAYKAQSPLFPHESTANQLFDEDQFEAYRALGHHCVESLFRPELLVSPLPKGATLRDWFQRLANSLLGN